MDSKTYEERISRFREALNERGIDVAVVSSWPNIEYLTGLRSLQSMMNRFDPMPLIVPRTGEPAYVCTAIYAKAIRAEYPWIEPFAFSEDEKIEPRRSLWDAVQSAIEARGGARGTVGYERESLTVNHYETMKRALPNAEMEAIDDIVPELRLLKDEGELQALREASRITDRAFVRAIRKGIREGMTERDLEVLIARSVAEEGALPSFIQIFVGMRTCFGNIAPSPQHAIKEGDIILFDFGVSHRGCGTDITRPVVLGRASVRQQEVAQAVKKIFLGTLEAVRPGVTAADVDRRAQEWFAKVGYADAYVHRTGHGLGTRPWERPSLSEIDDTPLRPGMALSVEQGIYLQEESIGIRLEDNLIVTEDGFEDMNHLSLDLVEL